MGIHHTSKKQAFSYAELDSLTIAEIGYSFYKWTDAKGTTGYRFHRTDVARVTARGEWHVSTGGYATPTTLKKIGKVLPRHLGYVRNVGDFSFYCAGGRAIPVDGEVAVADITDDAVYNRRWQMFVNDFERSNNPEYCKTKAGTPRIPAFPFPPHISLSAEWVAKFKVFQKTWKCKKVYAR